LLKFKIFIYLNLFIKTLKNFFNHLFFLGLINCSLLSNSVCLEGNEFTQSSASSTHLEGTENLELFVISDTGEFITSFLGEYSGNTKSLSTLFLGEDGKEGNS